MIATSENLDTFMEFDWTYHVDDDGHMTEALDVHGPDVFVQEEGGKPIVTLGWELLSGWSFQWMYSGPVMHDSEGIHPPMGEHILENPGYYVVTSVTYLGTGNTVCQECDAQPGEWCPDNCDGTENREDLIEGWVVAHKEEN